KFVKNQTSFYICNTMYRDFTKYLIEWQNRKFRKPLIIRGARQIGKTYTVCEFAKNKFQLFVHINFEEKPELKDFFKTNNIAQTIENLELYFNIKISDTKTLIFLDEIQICPEAIVSLRYFYEKRPKLHIIAAGSLLDHTLSNMPFQMPVGRVEFAYMYPLNFVEFLNAINEPALVAYIKNYSLDKEVNIVIHEKLLKLVRKYYFIGGMPEAIKVYANTNSFIDVERIHESIIKSFEIDFSKYGTSSQYHVLQQLLKYIPNAIGRKFMYSKAMPNIRTEKIKSALELLEKSRIIQLIKNTSANGVPLESGVNSKSFKPTFLDIGLVNHILKLRLIDIDNLITVNEGFLAEQFIAQNMITTTPFYIDSQLYYWQRDKKNAEAELDFVEEINGRVCPIEVKAGKTGSLKSLNIFVKEKSSKLALRFNADLPSKVDVDTKINMGKEIKSVKFKLTSLPLYLVSERDRLMY
ncbi:MAG: ATP-binding protein, partial [Bacteroidales bacterium]|nr:ATP-binding protein [Bacteroidales bacterium]